MDEWISLGCRGAGTDEVYYRCQHKPCGTEIEVLEGYLAICPKCQPEEWAEQERRGSATALTGNPTGGGLFL
jgi:hypothetical protein